MPWVEDARAFQGIDDVRGARLFQTRDISEFLTSKTSARTVVMAPKGCGKTLLIKYKRQFLEQTKDFRLIPENQLVAVAPDQARPFDNEEIRHFQEHKGFWSTLWQISIALAAIKAHDRRVGGKLQPKLSDVLQNEHLNDPFLIFANLLHVGTREFFHLQRDFQSVILPAYTSIRSQTAVFIDNVDEFFQHHLNDATRHTLHGQLDRDIWHHAQIGLLLATRILSAQNNHVKIYASIRTEAYNACKEELPDIANLRAHILSVSLTPSDLRAIYEQNLLDEDGSNCVEPYAADPWTRFFGSQSLLIRQEFTGWLEPIFDYLLRHTLSRPRDLMTIGKALSVTPRAERSPQLIRDVVNEAAVSLCESFLIETSPHYIWFDQDALFAQIDSNVFEPGALEALGGAYDDHVAELASAGAANPDRVFGEISTGETALDDLYSCGLLGVVANRPPRRGKFQTFESIYNVSGKYSNRSRSLPKASHYLVHPVLGSYLRKRYSCIGDNVDSVNIMAPNAPWTEDDGLGFVLQADIAGYTQIMEDPDRKDLFPGIFQNILDNARDGIEIVEHREGDRFMLADRSGYLLIRAAHKIGCALRESMFKCDTRFGLEYGAYRTKLDSESGERRILPNMALQQSARLEAASAPGFLLMKSHVYDALSRYRLDLPCYSICAADQGNGIKFAVSKNKKGWRYGKAKEGVTASNLIALSVKDITLE